MLGIILVDNRILYTAPFLETAGQPFIPAGDEHKVRILFYGAVKLLLEIAAFQ